jgi:cardiolipin synthase (CMP-forming)
MIWMLPNALTLLRIILAPVVCVLWGVGQQWAAFCVFVIAALTDFADGYLAVRTNSRSHFGAIFDPLADKIFIFTLLFFLAHLGVLGVSGVAASVIMLAREFLVLGLRSLSPGATHVPLPMARGKTAVQSIALGFFFLPTSVLQSWTSGQIFPGKAWPAAAFIAHKAGFLLLWFAVALSLISAWQYAVHACRHSKAGWF